MMEERYRVLVTDEIDPQGVEVLMASEALEVDVVPTLPEKELLTRIGEYHAIIGRSATRISPALLDHAGKLRIVGRAGVGVDNIALDRATALGIAVINAPGGNIVSVAELTLGMLIALVRHVHTASGSMVAGRWDRSSLGGTEVRGRTMTIVGLGRIGSEVAKRARAFGMRLQAVDPYVSEARFRDLGVERMTLADALPTTDVLTLHVPLTRETRGMVGARELASMPAHARVLNLSRGGVVDEEALAEAIREGRIAGAALDVYSAEPLPSDHPLRTMPSVLLTPHLGASTAEAQQNVAIEACQAVRDALVTGDLSAALNGVGLDGPGWAALRPAASLADRMGRLASALHPGGLSAVEVRYSGPREDAPRALTLAALQGIFRRSMDRRAVNLVNALHVAQEREVETSWARVASRGEIGEDIEITLRGEEGATRVHGSIFSEQHGRILDIDGYRVDVAPHGTLLILKNHDVPGVIGRVGTLLGEAGINIGEYHQARREVGGVALAAVTIDGVIDRDLKARLATLDEIIAVHQVNMEP